MDYKSILIATIACLATRINSQEVAVSGTDAKNCPACPVIGPSANVIIYKGPVNGICLEAFGNGVFTMSAPLTLDGNPNPFQGPCVDIPSSNTLFGIPLPLPDRRSFLFGAGGNLTNAYVGVYPGAKCDKTKGGFVSYELSALQEKCQFFQNIGSVRLFVEPKGIPQ